MHKIKNTLFSFLGLIKSPIVRVYDGFGNRREFFLSGHFLTTGPRPRKTYSGRFFRNMFAVIRLFMVKPGPRSTVTLEWGEQRFETESQADGYFEFHGLTPASTEPGMHKVKVFIESYRITGVGVVNLPDKFKTAFISDVDDTFLISHTGNTRRRLRELFTHNEHNRRAFEGVVNHYQQLSTSGRLPGEPPNPFFYVSSSEWNLYSFIKEFASFNHLPPGTLLLGKLKRIKDFLKSGQNNHATKLDRIVKVISLYENIPFVLLGDDSQEDPFIYREVVERYPHKVLAVYIRKIWGIGKNKGSKKKLLSNKPERVEEAIRQIESLGVSCCHFEHSSEALLHSKKIGLVLE